MITARDELISMFQDDGGEYNLTEKDCEVVLSVIAQLPPNCEGKVTLGMVAKALGAAYKKDRACSCGVCNRTVPSVTHAIEEGWSPDSWLTETEPGPAPVCCSCADRFFQYGRGELELRPAGEWLA